VGPIRGMDAHGGTYTYQRFGCTGWDLSTVWMHRVGPINGLDGKVGPYKRFGCTWWDLHVTKVWMQRVGPINGLD